MNETGPGLGLLWVGKAVQQRCCGVFVVVPLFTARLVTLALTAHGSRLPHLPCAGSPKDLRH